MSEMKLVNQTRLGPVEGNCFAACVATILGVPIEAVDFKMEAGQDWMVTFSGKIHPLGYCYIEWEWNHPEKQFHWLGECYLIATGESPRERCKHAVVVRHFMDGDSHCLENFFDPHPNGTFVENIEWIGALFPHNMEV